MDLAAPNCPATCSSWPRKTPPASPPAGMLLAMLRVSAPNAFRSACADANYLDLSDEETLALLNLLTQTIDNDRYPLPPRIQTLRGILAKFGPMAPAPPPPARPPTPEECDPSRRPRSKSRRDR